MAGRLPTWTRIVYGSGDWSISSFNTFRQIFYAAFLTDVVGLDPRLASLAALTGVAWDAVNDPIVGMLSDRVRTSWGRRRPFLLLFGIPFGLAFVGLWWAPPWESQAALAVHVAFAYIITDTLQSMVSVPFYALTPELTPDYDERTALTAWRMLFNLGASLAVAVAGPEIVHAAQAGGYTPGQGYLLTGVVFGVLGAVPPLLIGALIRERPDAPEQIQPSLREVLQGAWANVPFRWLTVLHLLNWTTFDLVGLMIPFLVRWRLADGQPLSTTTALLGMKLPVESAMLGALLVVSLPALPLWTMLSNRIGKREAYMVAMATWALVQIGISFVGPGEYGLGVLVSALAGVGVAAAHVLPDAMLPDVVDADELATGRRNEGIYYGARNLFRKGSGAIAVFFALQVLGWTGYVQPVDGVTTQAPAALLAIRLLSGVAGTVLLVGAIVAAWCYPMTRERHAEVRRELEARRAAAAAPEPASP